MVRQLLTRGMLVGVLAGLLAFAFARIFGEPQVGLAIAFEDRMRQLAGEAAEPEIVSRGMQASFGLLTGVVVYGCALGGMFSLAFAYAYGRLGRFSPNALAAFLAAAAFVVLVQVPQIKYPANPPSIGDPETIGARTALYFIMIALSFAGAAAALSAGQRLTARYGAWNATLIAGAGYLAAMAIVMLVLPPVNEVPQDFSAVVLWRFRLASLGIQAVLWTTLGIGFGASAQQAILGRESMGPSGLVRQV
jgi:Probable cobalt transporter subunit (CbtA)